MFYRQIISVLTGSGIAQAIPIVGSLAIVRLFSPESFGIYASWLSICLVLAVIFTFRFETAIATFSPGKKRDQATFNSIIVTLVSTAVCQAIFIFLYKVLDIKIMELNLLQISLSALCANQIATSQISQNYFSSEGEFKSLNILRVLQAALIIGSQVALGFSGENSANSLLISHAAAVIVSNIYALTAIIPKSEITLPTVSEVLCFVKENRKYVFFSLPADTMNKLSTELPVILVVSKFGADIGGALALTIRVLGAPLSLMAKSVLDVFKKHASDEYRDFSNCNNSYLKAFKLLLALGIGFFCLSYLLIEPVFLIAFGEDWSKSAQYALIMLPLFALRFVASPLSYVVYIVGKQEYDLIWQFFLLVMTLSVFSFSDDFSISLSIYTACYCFLYIVYLVMTRAMSIKRFTQ